MFQSNYRKKKLMALTTTIAMDLKNMTVTANESFMVTVLELKFMKTIKETNL